MKRPGIALGLALVLGAGCGGGTGAAAPPAEPAARPAVALCPPCRMEDRPHFERIEVEGLRFAICNPRCGEIVRQDPRRFAADALP